VTSGSACWRSSKSVVCLQSTDCAHKTCDPPPKMVKNAPAPARGPAARSAAPNCPARACNVPSHVGRYTLYLGKLKTACSGPPWRDCGWFRERSFACWLNRRGTASLLLLRGCMAVAIASPRQVFVFWGGVAQRSPTEPRSVGQTRAAVQACLPLTENLKTFEHGPLFLPGERRAARTTGRVAVFSPTSQSRIEEHDDRGGAPAPPAL
jgi:hypothetical protein